MEENEIMNETYEEETEESVSAEENGMPNAAACVALIGIGGLIGLGVKLGEKLPDLAVKVKDKLQDKVEGRREKRAAKRASRKSEKVSAAKKSEES